MKFLIILLAISCLTLAEDEETAEVSCEPWPKDLKPIRDCCSAPKRQQLMPLLNCEQNCAEKNSNVDVSSSSRSDEKVMALRECIESCALTNSTLFDAEKNFNKTAARFMYMNYNYGYSSYVANWSSLMSESFEKCEVGTTESVSENLATFFSCVDKNLIENCIDFRTYDDECILTMEHFEKCKKIETNCSVWPRELFSPQTCCNTPLLISLELEDKCRTECDSKEFFAQFVTACVNQCQLEGLKINETGKLDFDVIKSLLVENSNKSVDWAEAVEVAVGKAEKWMEKLNVHGSELQFRLLTTVLQHNLAAACADFLPSASCQATKRFFKKCAENVPDSYKMWE